MTTTEKRTRGWIMPVHFGSPFEHLQRQMQMAPEEIQKRLKETNYATTARMMSVSFLTNAEKLEKMMPEDKGLELRGDPVMTVTAIYQGALGWLAGRSYDIVMATFPVTFNGKERKVHGAFAPVVWENMTEPILAGRETLGWSKIYADIEPPAVMGNKVHCVAGWYGFKFMDLTIDNLRQLSGEEIQERQAKADTASEGSIHYKYIAKTGHPGEADADYLTISTNKGAPPSEMRSFGIWAGDGSIKFYKGTWEDVPTMIPVVNAFADLEIKEIVSASITKVESVGGGMGQTLMLE